MSALSSSDFIDTWAARLQDAVDHPSEAGFDGRRALPEFLRDSAIEQADRVFLLLDDAAVPDRDLAAAERLVEDAGLQFLLAWGETMATFHADREAWAKAAADAAVKAYHGRLAELALALHAGGRA